MECKVFTLPEGFFPLENLYFAKYYLMNLEFDQDLGRFRGGLGTRPGAGLEFVWELVACVTHCLCHLLPFWITLDLSSTCMARKQEYQSPPSFDNLQATGHSENINDRSS